MPVATAERKQLRPINLVDILPPTIKKRPLDIDWLDLGGVEYPQDKPPKDIEPELTLNNTSHMEELPLEPGLLIGLTVSRLGVVIVSVTPTYGTCKYPNCHCLD